jgi:tetratricopeptide (TPR) repeat protein
VAVTRAELQIEAALKVVADQAVSANEKIDMLVEIAVGLQTRPRSPDDLASAARLYDEALGLVGPEAELARARILARKGTALQAMPGDAAAGLEAARGCYAAALPAMRESGLAEELAELEMNHGLVLQSLAGIGRARIADAISAYQRALRVFNRAEHPKEFAILQNNLATAFIAIPLGDGRGRMREALAVQAFEEGLRAVTLIDHPTEYAMLQNNLGNALQYASSSHAVENNLRALDAYDEALKVRNRATTPLEFANTIANKANCLANLPDRPDRPEQGNPGNLAAALALLREAAEIFAGHGESGKAAQVEDAMAALAAELEAQGGPPPAAVGGTVNGHAAG